MAKLGRSSRDVIVRTQQLARAREYYGSVLGFDVAGESNGMLRIETGAIRLFVEQGPPHGPVFDFLVPDVQAARDRLLAAGCVLVEEDPAVPRCYLKDPFGLVFNLGVTPSPD